MAFTWRFNTGDRTSTTFRGCHRGPMIDVEVVMSRSFQYMEAFEALRVKFLKTVVNTTTPAVSTRETILRVLDSNISPIFLRLLPRRKALQVPICEKRNSKAIADDLLSDMPFFQNAARAFAGYNLPTSQVTLLLAALESNSPVLRVAGMSAVVLLAAYMEMDNNGN
jgi:hypothetical protein